jgi:hypothetical protein
MAKKKTKPEKKKFEEDFEKYWEEIRPVLVERAKAGRLTKKREKLDLRIHAKRDDFISKSCNNRSYF